jgi:hypothetical protein
VLVALLAIIATLPVVWYLGSPLFVSRIVHDEAPGVGTAAQVLVQGRFGVIDAIHTGEGTAVILQLPDGQRVLRLDDFRVTNGPDLYVYLSGHPAPRSSAELHADAAFEVAALKGNVGGQTYALPANLDLSAFGRS